MSDSGDGRAARKGVGEREGPVPPVVVGALDGSGTRVVARMLEELGFFMGLDLNHAWDNLWFTLLFKRHRWYYDASRDDVLRHLRLFEEAMTDRVPVGPGAVATVLRAAAEQTVHGYDLLGAGRGMWPWYRVRSLAWARIRDRPVRPARWGWKEPSTHVFLPEIADHFGGRVRYLHVVRHGLDMAVSSNVSQLGIWGPLFDLPHPGSVLPEELPALKGEYWVRVNDRAEEVGRARLGDRFRILSFDRLCEEPRRQVRELVEWLGLEVEEGMVERLAALVRPPPTLGRYRTRHRSAFPPELVERVRARGFRVDFAGGEA